MVIISELGQRGSASSAAAVETFVGRKWELKFYQQFSCITSEFCDYSAWFASSGYMFLVDSCLVIKVHQVLWFGKELSCYYYIPLSVHTLHSHQSTNRQFSLINDTMKRHNNYDAVA